MMDASGKLPSSGVLQGSILSLPGNMDSCLDVDSEKFKGQYCLLSLRKGESRRSFSEWSHQHTLDRGVGDLIQQLLLSGGLKLGHCVPDSCTEEDTVKGLDNFLKEVQFPGKSISLGCRSNTPVEMEVGDYIVIALVLGFILLVTVGTIVDVSMIYFGDQCLHKYVIIIFQGFSCITTLHKVFYVAENKDNLGCINGIRFISMAWVIVGHTYLMTLSSSAPFLSNSLSALQEYSNSFGMRTIFNATPSVDSFFLIGSTLLAYITLKEMEKHKGGSVRFWVMYYVHRYLRLTGVYAVVLALHATLLKFLATGPQHFVDNLHENCATGWWANLLYVNNFFSGEEDGENNCMGWTWYMANDMQMFIISPIFIVSMFHWPIFGVALTLLTYLASTIRRIIASSDRANLTFSSIYIKPWYRIGPYAIGLVLGYILFKTRKLDSKTANIPSKLSFMLSIIGWAISLGTFIGVVFGVPADMGSLSDMKFTIYYGLFRNVWAIALAWLIFACAKVI